MSNDPTVPFELDAEVARFFDPSSLSNGDQPRFAVLMGGVGAGKTTLRKQRFFTGYVLVDAAEIFLNLSRGKYFPFFGHLEQPMDKIGRRIAERAIADRRNIVTELIGGEIAPTKALLQVMTAIDYKTEIHGLSCDLDIALQRNANRDGDSISAYYAEPYQRRWLYDAAHAASTTTSFAHQKGAN